MDTIQIVIMGAAEAREVVEDIKRNLADIGDKLLDLNEREGWRSLGYASWRECVMAEFDFGQSRAYQLLGFARVRRAITTGSTLVETPPNERVVRPLTSLPPETVVPAWQDAEKLAEGQPITAKHTEQAAQKYQPHSKADSTRWGSRPKANLSGFNQASFGDDFSQVERGPRGGICPHCDGKLDICPHCGESI